MDAAKNACTLDIVLNLYRSGLLSSFSVAKSEWNEGIIFLPECGNSNDLNKAALTRVFAFFLFQQFVDTGLCKLDQTGQKGIGKRKFHSRMSKSKEPYWTLGLRANKNENLKLKVW